MFSLIKEIGVGSNAFVSQYMLIKIICLWHILYIPLFLF